MQDSLMSSIFLEQGLHPRQDFELLSRSLESC
jgi:hypothetical protein